jgi:alkanesulfonate monooxygenase SsuD/methylene tetrahydromethanopterin reductase-like flavin-dependent oxidoreductase (luciferase family)
LLKTTDPAQTVEEFGRRFLVDRILVATGTPKSIVDKLEEIHFASGANGGFILGRGYSAMDNIREFVELVVPELQRRGLSKKAYTGRRCGKISPDSAPAIPPSVPRLRAY